MRCPVSYGSYTDPPSPSTPNLLSGTIGHYPAFDFQQPVNRSQGLRFVQNSGVLVREGHRQLYGRVLASRPIHVLSLCTLFSSQTGQHRQSGTTRSSSQLRAPMPGMWRRTRTDPVSASHPKHGRNEPRLATGGDAGVSGVRPSRERWGAMVVVVGPENPAVYLFIFQICSLTIDLWSQSQTMRLRS